MEPTYTIVPSREYGDSLDERIASIIEPPAGMGVHLRTVYLNIIHQRLFDGDGEFRNFDISYPEPILNGETVVFAKFQDIDATLRAIFDEEQKVNYAKLDFEAQISRLAKFTSAIWQTHSFVEGNTRTVAVFIEKYMRTLGWDVNNEPFKENSAYFRDALVLSNYANPQKKIAPRFEFIESFFAALLAGKELVPL